MDQQNQRRLVCISYAQEDQKLCEQLVRHLSQLINDELMTLWLDRDIPAGLDRVQAITQAFSSAQVILLLISADYLASKGCLFEMQQALERIETGKARVIPLLGRPCDWRSAPFAHLDCLPDKTTPITSWKNLDEAFAVVVAGIRRAITDGSLSQGYLYPPALLEESGTPLGSQAPEPIQGMHVFFSWLGLPLLLQWRWFGRRIWLMIGVLLLVGSIAWFGVENGAFLPHPPRTIHLHPTPTIVASPSPTQRGPSMPSKILGALCGTDYQTQWGLFAVSFREDEWSNDETRFVTGLQDRDIAHGEVVQCHVSNVVQNNSTASGTVTATFGDRSHDSTTFYMARQADGEWKIVSFMTRS